MSYLAAARAERRASSTSLSRGERTIFAAVAANCVTLLVLLDLAGLHLNLRSVGTAAYVAVFAGLALAAWVLRDAASRAGRLGGEVALFFGAFTALSLTGALASYPVAALSHGMVDRQLQATDDLIGFDWLAMYRLVATHPWLQDAGRVSYNLIYVLPAIVLAWLLATGRRRDAVRFTLTVWLATWLTLTAFYFTPALGPLATLWHGPVPYLPLSRLWQPEVIPALRGHVFGPIDPGHVVGLVSMPSFHTAGAVVLALASLPHAPLRRIVLPLDTAMMLAIPIEGTHYLADMLGGAAVALLAAALIRVVERHLAAPRRSPTAPTR